jgi:WD40 repeat protein
VNAHRGRQCCSIAVIARRQSSPRDNENEAGRAAGERGFLPGRNQMHRILCVACLFWVGCLRAAEPPADPILKIDPLMHTAAIFHIATDARFRWLVTAAHDKTARVWDLATGRLQTVIRPPIGLNDEGKLYAVALSPDGAVVALGGWTQFNEGQSGLSAQGQAILIFDRASGRMLKRIDGVPAVIFGLAFSPDGRYLAATLAGNGGLRLYRSETWALIAQDADYGDSSFGADFSRDGRLVTSSDDGYVRLYHFDRSDLHLLKKAQSPAGTHPYAVRFSPSGESIAVGCREEHAVHVIDASTLELRYSPDASGRGTGDFTGVAWSTDGQALYAAGAYRVQAARVIRRWPSAGQGAPRDALAAADTIMDLFALPQGGIVYAAGQPAWGILDAGGQRARWIAPPTADLRDSFQSFGVSRDGRTVKFAFEASGNGVARFDPDNGLRLGEDAANPLASPRTEAPDLPVTDWFRHPSPRLGGKPLGLPPDEVSHSLAIAPDGKHFALGADWSVSLFDGGGEKLWRVALPVTAWGVDVSGDGQTVVAALSDGTIRWYDISDGREKLAFFPHADRKRWVAWTPSGYYQASPGGEDLIGWHLNHGPSASADFFPASRLRSKFNRPDIVARAVSTASEAEAVRLANQDSGRRSEATLTSVRAMVPPVVEILSPQDGASVATDNVALRFAMRSPSDAPVTSLRARVNGQSVSFPDGRGLVVTGAEGEREIKIPLQAADNEIQLFAESRNGVSTPAVLHVTSSRPVAAASDAMLKPNLYVLAVGVSKYQNPNFNLGLASKDANDFANVFRKQKGVLYADVQVRLLTDADATKDNVLDGLDWLQHQVTQHDVGMIFLAGHGLNDNSGKYYFLPHNADPDKLLRTGVPQSEISDALKVLPGKAVFFIDTCHSGNALGTAKARGLGDDISNVVNDLTAAENGVVVFSAATGRQSSLEDPAWGNGAFTKAVVEGLEGSADMQKSGRVTIKELDYYVAERVKQLTDGRQSPVSIAPNGVPDFPIAIDAK